MGGGVIECTVRPLGKRTDAAPVGARFIVAPFFLNILRAIRVKAVITKIFPTPAVPCTKRHRGAVFSGKTPLAICKKRCMLTLFLPWGGNFTPPSCTF